MKKRRHIVVSAAMISAIILLLTKWIEDTDPKMVTENPLPIVRRSVSLNDGKYDYHLNLSSFESEFPHLQSYQCSLIHTPHAEPEGEATQPVLILAIKSHPGSGVRRSALRQTWAKEQEINGHRVRPIFLLGNTEASGQMELVKVESEVYGDILQWDMTEGHHNLSLKERCLLEWLHHHLPQVAFIFKGDDDEFVNPAALIQYIEEHRSSPYTLHGALQRHSVVLRYSKYKVSTSLFPNSKYPYFLSGGGFLFPGTSVNLLYEASQMLPVFPLDDVYFGFLVLASNLTFRHDSRFYVFGLEFEACRFRKALVVHSFAPDHLVKIWSEIQAVHCNDTVSDVKRPPEMSIPSG